MKIRRFLPPLLLLLSLLALQAWDPAALQAIRHKIFDAYQRSAPAQAASDPTLIVDIDEHSIATIGQWPWDRATVAKLLAGIDGAKVVALDIVFPETDRLSPALMAERLAKAGWQTTSPNTLTDNDAALAATIADLPIVTAIAAAPVRGLNPLPKASVATLGGSPDKWLPHFTGAIANLPLIAAKAAGAGNITIEPGLDGVVRQMPLLAKVEDAYLPALSIETMRVAAADQTIVARLSSWGVSELIAGDVRIPTDGYGRVWLHYAPHDKARFISALDILEGRIPAGTFAGKHVIIGSSAFGLWDLRATPLGYSMPGVEIQAQTIDALRSGDLLQRPNFTIGIEIAVTMLAGLFIIFIMNQVGASWTLIGHLLVTSSIIAGSWSLYQDGWLLDASYPATATTLIYLAMVYAGHVRSENRREGLSNAFKKYLSPVLVERLNKDGAKVDLGGELKETTTLFADLKGFTPLSERLQHQPQRLTRLVNMLLDGLSDAVLCNDGTIDKFMGDNVMALWNAPLDDPDHARKACLAALDMQRRIADINHTLKSDPDWADVFDGSIHLAAGVGINTGTCVVGNFGSHSRLDYSAIGDSVNLAARFEGAAKRFDVCALVTAATMTAANAGKPELAFLPLGHIFVRGRTSGTDAFGLVGDAARAASPEFKLLRAKHDAVMAAYEASDWNAFDRFAGECRALAPDLSRLYDALRDNEDLRDDRRMTTAA